MISCSLAALKQRASLVCSLTLSPVLLATDAWAQQAQPAIPLDPIEVSPANLARPKQPDVGRSGSAAQSRPKSAQGHRTVSTQTNTDSAPALNLTKRDSTGSRLNLTPLETPASVGIITSETIAERGQHNVLDAVTQNATGFTASPAPGNGGLSFNTRGFTGINSVMTLYDGTLLYPAAGTITFPFDTWSAGRIEVMRGPASVLYGAGAIGGVINVASKKPLSAPYNQAEMSLDTNLTRRLAVDSGGPINPDVSYRVNAIGNMSDGWVDRDKTSNLAISAAVRMQATDSVAFTLSNDYGDRSPSRYFGTPLINNTIDEALRFKNYNVLDSHIRYQDNWTQFKTEWDVTDGISVRNTMYYLTSHRHWRDVETYAWNPATRMIDRSDYIEIFHDQAQIGNRMDATLRGHVFGFSNEFVAGFDVNRIDFTHTNNSPYGGSSSVDPFSFNPGLFSSPDRTAPSFNAITNQYAVFAEDRLKLSDQLAIVGGVRLDQPSIERTDFRDATRSFETSLSGLSWRVGTVYNPIKDLAVYGQYSTAVDPVGTLITTSAAQKDFKLATGKQIEVGVKQSFWNGRGEWTIAGYQIVKNDLLARDPIHPEVVMQVGQQSSRGVEASVGLVLDHGWRVDANIALLRAKYDNFTQSVDGVPVSFAGNVPINVPQQVSNVWATWEFAPNWSVYGGVQMVGKTFADNANTLSIPSYAIVNGGLRWKPDPRTTVALRLYNLFDKVYATSGDTGQWLLGMPRTAELSINVKF
ncbi:TonB-dependent receptor [Bradyrhizobium erythrophlei]|uniref:TonB-dependent receptor n=1 Tax=Bradyrhizobium erythrophlei TaxID=1437360 RepID=UPI0035E8EEA8